MEDTFLENARTGMTTDTSISYTGNHVSNQQII